MDQNAGSLKNCLIEQAKVHVFTIPTDAPEADGTLEWNETTIIVVEIRSNGEVGTGYSFGDPTTATIAREHLFPLVAQKEVWASSEIWGSMVRAVRNAGRPGIASHAISAVDVALWDLKARLLGLPLATLLGKYRAAIPAYGSGGFTSYSVERLQNQLSEWTRQGLGMVKMKVGSDPKSDPDRVKAAREAIGPRAQLFVDANGAYSKRQALDLARSFAMHEVTWFEEPVSSDDLEGLRFIRDLVPEGVAVAAGEYGYDPVYFRKMLAAGAVDVLQADATRCCGVTGFLKVAALSEAWMTPLSAHTAPTLHAHLCCAVPGACHVEYFHDHARIEQMLFDGALTPNKGLLIPHSLPGLGIQLKKTEVQRYVA
jgi:L-alanine-DL-glutamate epimerase-like enolase superfamily enzyme